MAALLVAAFASVPSWKFGDNSPSAAPGSQGAKREDIGEMLRLSNTARGGMPRPEYVGEHPTRDTGSSVRRAWHVATYTLVLVLAYISV